MPETIKYIRAAAFANCISLKKVSIPSNCISIGRNAFQNCDKLTELDFPESVNSFGYAAFYNIGANVIIRGIGVNQGAFVGCKIKNLIFKNPNVELDNSSLTYCTLLENLTIENPNYQKFSKLFQSANTVKNVTKDEVYPGSTKAYRYNNTVFALPTDDSKWYYREKTIVIGSETYAYLDDEVEVISSKRIYETTVGVYYSWPTSIRITGYKVPSTLQTVVVNGKIVKG